MWAVARLPSVESLLSPAYPLRSAIRRLTPGYESGDRESQYPCCYNGGSGAEFRCWFDSDWKIAPTDVQLSFDCSNSNPAPINTGLNTLLLSASSSPVPDIVALAATSTNDGIANISGTNGTGAFAVATVNWGATGTISVSGHGEFLVTCEHLSL